MRQEYKMSKGWSIFVYLFAPVLIAVSVYLGVMPFTFDAFDWLMVVVLVPLSVGMTVMMIYGVLSTYKGKLIIHSDRVEEIGVFKNTVLELSDIKGYQSDQNYIYLIPKTTVAKRIKISQYIGKKREFHQWLNTNFQDVETLESEQDVEAILANEAFGRTMEEREDQLKRARRVAQTLNIMAGILALTLFFYPVYYELTTLLALVFPIFILISLHMFKGLIHIDQKKNSGYPTLAYSIIFPSVTLALRSLLDFDILEYKNLWLSATVITVVVSLALFTATNEIKFKKKGDFATVFFVMAFVFVYAYGGVVNYNCLYDTSQPEPYVSEVVDRRVSTGKTTSYYVEVAPWGPVTATDEVSVTEDLYNQLAVGDAVNIYLMEGKLGIPWFEIHKK